MATIRARSPATISPAKKPKIDSTVLEQQQRAKSDEATERHQDHISLFTPNLFDPSNIHRLNNYYHASEPYKYALVEKLFQDDLLKNVVDECLSELHFTERETDIYKVSLVARAPVLGNFLRWADHLLYSLIDRSLPFFFL